MIFFCVYQNIIVNSMRLSMLKSYTYHIHFATSPPSPSSQLWLQVMYNLYDLYNRIRWFPRHADTNKQYLHCYELWACGIGSGTVLFCLTGNKLLLVFGYVMYIYIYIVFYLTPRVKDTDRAWDITVCVKVNFV